MSSKLKVLQVIPRLGYGGAEIGCYDLAHYLKEQKSSSFIATSGGELLKYIDKKKVKLFRLPVQSKNPFLILINIFILTFIVLFYKIDYNVNNMKKLFVLLLIILPFNLAVADKQTTFDNDIFNKAQSDGKTVIVSSWIKYCTSCASQMKALKDVEKDFDNLIYLTFDVTNREIAKQLNIQFQTTLVIYKNNKEVYRSLGELTKDKIYKAINSVI